MTRPEDQLPDSPQHPEPRWPAITAMVVFAALRYGLPPSLTWSPGWTVVLLVGVFEIQIAVARRKGNNRLNEIFAYILLAAVTVDLLVSLVLLVLRLPAHRDTPRQLLLAALALWLSNVIVFASWYWRLDAGGPNRRDSRRHHKTGAFLFPQMTSEDFGPWKPRFIDYLFLAWTASTAFSPTDAPVLSRWAKGLMMLQTAISVSTVVLLAARAINVL